MTNKKEKATIASNELANINHIDNLQELGKPNKNKRGYTIYSPSQITGITGRDQEGRLMTWGREEPYFHLSIQQRIEIFRLSSPVFGVVSSRMNRLAGLGYNITTEKYKEDELAYEMKDNKDIYQELQESLDLQDLITKSQIFQQLKNRLPELRPDLSNFDKSLLRWKRRISTQNTNNCNKIADWLQEPNLGVSWEDFVKKYVFDYLIHGAAAIYKDVENNVLKNFDLLPGGTVYRIKDPYFNNKSAFVQVVPGVGEAQIFFSNEVIYSDYLPSSARNYGFIPLEALINKVSESLLFDKLMAEQADGTKPPEKFIIVTEQSPFGSMDTGLGSDIPMDMNEQKRLEQKINEPTKNAIMTFSGNKAEVIDLSRENTMAMQNQRQKDIREDVALVFNMSNLEINLTGSDGTSGRSTSEAQMELEQGKGVAPIAKNIENTINRGLLPYAFGSGFVFEFEKSRNEKEEKELDILMLQTGELTQNEIREKYNKSTFKDEEFNKPKNESSAQVDDGTQGDIF